ncbi:MAG: hypothetical protein A2570_01425 [Candidatus Brennerbacteria bacterium RIFOXYD1_FULL_41_16]|jgi:excisionase family DNA binding protein|uniref:Helix-turn-helix domain-containing protein n=1 Tax=Candidatus Brennerbacteria bacterium RIFOXYD1_FULL_41_16 TaxID=1797529 RepID=A0A1G1XL59_9BACT|nr:MAG: hypothetical protein A2570_01425 [Candidatus Brennerbacteria bacterium RIFOXYD1_FULL_41_16]
MTEKFLTIEQVAKKLDLNYKTIFRYIHKKKIKATKLGRWRIKPKDLEEFIRSSSNLRKK